MSWTEGGEQTGYELACRISNETCQLDRERFMKSEPSQGDMAHMLQRTRADFHALYGPDERVDREIVDIVIVYAQAKMHVELSGSVDTDGRFTEMRADARG